MINRIKGSGFRGYSSRFCSQLGSRREQQCCKRPVFELCAVPVSPARLMFGVNIVFVLPCLIWAECAAPPLRSVNGAVPSGAHRGLFVLSMLSQAAAPMTPPAPPHPPNTSCPYLHTFDIYCVPGQWRPNRSWPLPGFSHASIWLRVQ